MMSFAEEFASLAGSCRFVQETIRQGKNASTDAFLERLDSIEELMEKKGRITIADVMQEYNLARATAQLSLTRLVLEERAERMKIGRRNVIRNNFV